MKKEENNLSDKAKQPAKLTTKTNIPDKRTRLTTPLSAQGVPVFLIWIFFVLGVIHILNPGSGVIELIPDNLPIIGNLDEGGAFLAIWYGLIEFFEGRKFGKTNTNT